MEGNCIVHKFIHKQSWDRRTGELLEDSLTKVPLDMSLDMFISQQKEPSKMNYLQASELYKALHEGKIVQFKWPEHKTWTNVRPSSDGKTVLHLWGGEEWRIKPEPREFYARIYTDGSVGELVTRGNPGNTASYTTIKVREVLED